MHGIQRNVFSANSFISFGFPAMHIDSIQMCACVYYVDSWHNVTYCIHRVYDFGFYLHFLWRQSVNKECTHAHTLIQHTAYTQCATLWIFMSKDYLRTHFIASVSWIVGCEHRQNSNMTIVKSTMECRNFTIANKIEPIVLLSCFLFSSK